VVGDIPSGPPAARRLCAGHARPPGPPVMDTAGKLSRRVPVRIIRTEGHQDERASLARWREAAGGS